MKLIVFTDGAAHNNGKLNCKAGVGIYIPEKNIEISEKYENNPTNQRAELTAIKKAIEITSEELIIYTDSMYSINCLTKWNDKWIKNDWKNSKKETVKNKDIIQDILILMNDRNIEFKHIR